MQMLDEDTKYQLCASQGSQESQGDVKNFSVCESTLRYESDITSESILFRLNEVEEVCRICLSSGSNPIFGIVDLSDDLERFASIEVRADDCLPQHICAKCWELLDNAILLRKIAQNTDKVLRMKAEEVDSESQESQSMSVGKISTDEIYIEPITTETSDGENSDNGVYLEYTESANESDNESERKFSNVEENNVSLDDTASIVESIELDSNELQTLVDSLNKNAKWLKCEVCNIIFRTSEQLNDHTSTHNSEEIIICEVCKNIIHKDLYSMHLRLHKESFMQRRKNKIIECTVCGKSYQKFYMKTHMNIHEKGERRLKKCTVCFKSVTANYLSAHIKRLHSQKDITDKSHDQEKKQVCPVCSRMVKESIYKNHVTSHAASRKKYVCEECGREMFTYSSFKTHMLTHKDEYKFKCQFCPYRGKHLGLLKIHVRTHTKDYAYQCSVCNARFITKSNLTVHSNTHSTGARFICSECGMCFVSERSLRYHRSLKHKVVKPVFCDICGKKYAFNDVLLHHKRTVHHVPPKRIGRTPSYLLAAQNND